MYIYKLYICTHAHTDIYIYLQKGTLSGPHFSTFLEMQCFCYIMFLYVHIPVMVLLEIHTDCQTSSEVAKECPESHEDSQGKGRRKNKHSVCIYMASLRGRGGQGKNEEKKSGLSPLIAPLMYIASP